MAALHSVVKEWFLSLTKVSGSPEAIYLDLAQTALSHTTASFLDGASAAVDFPLLHVLTTPVILDPVTRTVVKKEVEEMQSIMATFLQSTKGSHMMAYEHYLTHLRQLSNIVRGSETVVEVAQRGAASWILPARVETKRQMTALEQEIVKNDESTDALRSTMKEQLKSKAKLRALQTQLVELNGAMTARPLKKQNFATALQLAVKYRLGAATGHAVLDSLPGPTPITRLTGLLPNEFYQVVLRPVATVVPFSALLVVLSTYGKYLLVYAIKRSRTLRRAAVHSCSLFELYVPLVIPFLVVYVNNVKGSVSPYLYISLLLPIQRVVFFLLLLACGTLNSMVCKRVQRYFIHWARLGERRRQ
ncbi:hypothetical protein AGDE_10573 [Angomonas deanei]|nr:hypothetical protein AGDE_10573 [Angomonas deanei]|eukprot:EPY28055.1 hypothetical protein AGDE_10573 [Angomonas deanei]